MHPYRGGIAHFNEALYHSLEKEGHQVHVVSFSVQYPGVLFPGKSQYDTSEPDKPVSQERLINSVWPPSWWKAGRKIASRNPDLVIIRFWLPVLAPALGAVARAIRKRSPDTVIVGLTDNIIPHEKRIGDKPLTKYFINSCDGFLTMSESVMEELNQFTRTKCKIFSPHPVYDIFGKGIPKSTARQQLEIPEDRRVVLFFGFVRRYKGLDLLVRAIGRKEVRDLDVHLIVCGEFYEDRRSYERMIDEKGIRDKVTLLDRYVDKEEVAQYFCAADIVAQTYRTATQSGVTQIAYHFGRPILITDVGGLSEIVDDKKSGYVTAANSKSIAHALVDFYENNREADMTEAVKRDGKRFTWKAMVNRMETLYSAIKNEKCEELADD